LRLLAHLFWMIILVQCVAVVLRIIQHAFD
jgi:hypothetical protein